MLIEEAIHEDANATREAEQNICLYNIIESEPEWSIALGL